MDVFWRTDGPAAHSALTFLPLLFFPPLQAFIFIYKPTLYIPFKDIETVTFDRVGGAVGRWGGVNRVVTPNADDRTAPVCCLPSVLSALLVVVRLTPSSPLLFYSLIHPWRRRDAVVRPEGDDEAAGRGHAEGVRLRADRPGGARQALAVPPGACLRACVRTTTYTHTYIQRAATVG